MRIEIGKLAAMVTFVAASAVASATARADDIVIFNTGVNNSKAVVAPGTADPHWQVIQVPAGSTFAVPRQATVAAAHPAYVPNSAVGSTGSSWISLLSNTNNFFTTGTYVYRTTFDLTGLDPATAVIVGTLAVDDSVTDVRVNGVSTGALGGMFVAMNTSFHFASGFVNGVNTIDFQVLNSGGSANPTGIRVAISGTAAKADSVAPVITGASDRSLSWQGSPITLTAASLGISATDNVDGSVPVTISPASVGLGAHLVTASAHDAAGNVATGTFTVTVVDVTAPVITGPSSTTPTYEYHGHAITLTSALLGLFALDDVDGAVAVTLTPASAGVGTTSVTAQATDAAGNVATRTFDVRVADTTAPVFLSLSVSPDVLNSKNHSMAQVTVSATVADAGDAAPDVRITSIGCTDDDLVFAAGLSNADWNVTSALTADLRCERTGKGSGRTYVLTVVCTDASGNTASANVTVFVPHDNGKKSGK